MASECKNGVRVMCVTGPGGYIGSWLVKNLLQNGYTVNATLRDPRDKMKCGPFLALAGAGEKLKLFQADLLEKGSFDSAVDGCQGVFHVAGPMGRLCWAAVNGVVNVMRACTKAKSVRRIVFTSSIAAACPLDENGELWSSCRDESCWSPLNFLKSKTNRMAWHMAAKILAEQEALKYGAIVNLEVVSILPPTVIGPWFTSLPAFTSSQTILALIGENDAYYKAFKFAQFLMGYIGVVHIDDLCNAHIFFMKHPKAQGRYICYTDSRSLNSLKECVSKQLNVSLKMDEDDLVKRHVSVSSKKLMDMGFTYKHGLEKAFRRP